MKTTEEIKKIALHTIEREAVSINGLKTYVNNDFAKVVEMVLHGKGRVIMTGIGKSAIIASKIAATLNSTGTPAVYMHAADAVHGDIGIVCKDDIVFCLSKSGNTPEIRVLVPLLKMRGNALVAMVGNTDSYLANQAEYIINTSVEKEACSNNLIPTSSTTAQLVMGDALAVCLLECRGFSEKDFAHFHPGGAIGRQIYLNVGELAGNNLKPCVNIDAPLAEVIFEISDKRLGITAVICSDAKLCGIITDGDLRRMLQKKNTIEGISAGDIMSHSPRTVDKSVLAADALRIMEQYNITSLLVTEDENYFGVVHLHDILKEGIL